MAVVVAVFLDVWAIVMTLVMPVMPAGVVGMASAVSLAAVVMSYEQS